MWLHAKQHIAGFFSFPKSVLSGFVYNKTFKWKAKNQTLGWTVCLASPSAAVKIKGNNQQITQHSAHSLFFVHFYVSAGWWRGLMLYYEPAHLAPLDLLFFPETLYFLQRGSWRKGAPSQPNSAHPEVNGAEGADWPGAPEPSRHTTGWGCRHPPVKCLLPAVLLFSFSFFLSLIPLFEQEVIGMEKKKDEDEEWVCCSKQAESPAQASTANS